MGQATAAQAYTSPFSSTNHATRRRVVASLSHRQRLNSLTSISQIRAGSCRLCATPLRVSLSTQRRSAAYVVLAAHGGPESVVVTGAAGRTGSMIMKKLLAKPEAYQARGVVRNEEGKEKALGGGVPADAVVVADVAKGQTPDLDAAMQGAQALIIASSAVPQVIPKEGGPPEFYYREGQNPEQVDWIGQKAQIDAAKAAGVRRVVLISSMGGTDRGNRLNAIANGNILVYKRQSEEYLMESGLEYTILHPGGLTMDEGGQREVLLGVDDGFITENKYRSIPRADVAELAVQAVSLDEAKNRSVDVVAKPVGEGSPTTDFGSLFAALTADCKYGPESVKG